MLGCLLVGILSGASTLVAQVAINVSYAFAQMLLVLLLCDKAYRFRTPIIFLYGIGRACLSAALFVGSSIGHMLSFLLGEGSFWGTEVMYGIVLLGSFAAIVFWMAGNDYQTAFVGRKAQEYDEGELIDTADSNNTDNTARSSTTADIDAGGDLAPTHEPSDDLSPNDRAQLLQDLIERRCNVLAREYRLSKRETEVLVLLGWGKSAKRIEELLVLSANTVKTHVRHIYSKLGIHSRAELDTLIDEVQLPENSQSS